MSKRITEDLQSVESGLIEAVSSPRGILSEIALDTLTAGGKRLRPALVLICGQAGDYSSQRLLPAAVAVELVHTASLVHDDILDRAVIRRGAPTVYAAWGERMASAAGDFLFAKAFECLAGLSDPAALVALSDAAVALCLGEFEQMQTAHLPHQSVEGYLGKIERKTAALFAACCRLGGILAGADEPEIEALEKYGYDLGIAFQIYDDILDFTGGAALGKPTGTDLRDGTVTMPMLYAMDELKESRALVAVIEALNPDDREVFHAIELVERSCALDRAKAQARSFVDRAIAVAGGLSNQAVAKQLSTIGEFVIDRYS
ncbi:MAG: polyprenyl synthetase family protein [Actinobacteria bacterium]|nr:polyprenyl synthetase family protein [Actinomycetota bacterium]